MVDLIYKSTKSVVLFLVVAKSQYCRLPDFNPTTEYFTEITDCYHA